MKNIFKLALVMLLSALSGKASAQSGDFVTKWNLATQGSGTTQLSFGTATSGIVSYSWTEVGGSGSNSGTFSGSTLTIAGLPSGKTIELRISPTHFQRIIINNGTDKNRLLDVEQWGTTVWTSMNTAFKGCSNLNITATDVPTLSSVTDMYGMFTGCAKLNGPSNINSWNTIRVTTMYDLFNGCTIFNQNIGSWKTDSVTSMLQMFRGASAFNQNIGSWNTGRVGSFQQTFTNCTAFNQDISSWNTANAGEMNGMFQGATAFNQNIGGWNTAKVANMNNMFNGATAFNQSIGNWSLKSNVTMTNMLTNCGMDCNNYTATLIGWSSTSATGRSLGATGRTYANGLAARTTLTGTKSWTIIGDAIGACPDPTAPFITTWNLATTGSGANQLSFGVATSGTVNYDWTEIGGSGSNSGTFSGSTATITGLPTGATIRLRIFPTHFQRIIINNGTDKNRLLDVKQWGATDWTSMEKAFNGCINLNITATDVPDLSSVKSMFGTFTGCVKLNGPSNINTWNTIRVSNMYDLFNGCTIFNQNIGSWKTDSVTSMLQMFRGASAFNQNIGSWNTGRVGTFQQTFTNCTAFNQDISNWNTANAGEMNGMFQGATAFNQNIGNWNTAKVANMNNMFNGASAFNQDLGNWSLKSNVTMANMLTNCGMNCNNYSATLIGWSSTSATGRSLGATGRTYGSYASSARTTLTTATVSGGKGWTITDAGLGTCSAPSVPGLEDQTAMNEVIGKASIWPNPVADMLNIEINEIYQDEKLYLTVTDMKGSVLMSQTVTHGNSAISTAGWPNALYVVTLRSEHDIIMISKISKQ